MSSHTWEAEAEVEQPAEEAHDADDQDLRNSTNVPSGWWIVMNYHSLPGTTTNAQKTHAYHCQIESWWIMFSLGLKAFHLKSPQFPTCVYVFWVISISTAEWRKQPTLCSSQPIVGHNRFLQSQIVCSLHFIQLLYHPVYTEYVYLFLQTYQWLEYDVFVFKVWCCFYVCVFFCFEGSEAPIYVISTADQGC